MAIDNHAMDEGKGRIPVTPLDTGAPSHERPPFADPLAGGDPTAPGAPNEPGGITTRQSEYEHESSPEVAERILEKGEPAE